MQSFLTELDNYTLADLVVMNQPLYKLLLVGGRKSSSELTMEEPRCHKILLQEREAENTLESYPEPGIYPNI